METLLSILQSIGIIFIVIMFFNIMIFVHELGHFLAGKWRGAYIDRFQIWFGKPIWSKKIWGVQWGLGWIPAGGFVSLPQLEDMQNIEGKAELPADLKPLKAKDKVIIAAAGPLFSLLVGLLAYVGLSLYVGSFSFGAALAAQFALGSMPAEVVLAFPPLSILLFFFLIEVSCWWTLLNMLPIFPLDGGQIMQGLMKSRQQMHGISLAAAIVFTSIAAVLGLWLLAIFMGLLAVLNHKFYKEARDGGTDFH